MFKKATAVLPGLIASVLVMLSSMVIANFIPLIGGATLAIFLGMFFGNTILKQDILEEGTKFTASKLLEVAIVLLGCSITFSTILELGLNGLAFIVAQLVLTIFICFYVAKRFNFSKKLSLLLAAGSGVCGSSAIGATTPVIKASEEEKSNAIMITNIMGTVLMVALPIITFILYNHEIEKTAAMMGGTLQAIGQVVASGLMVNEATSDLATLFKLVRVSFLVVVVVAMGLYAKENQENSKIDYHRLVPWYIIGFFILSIISSFGLIPNIVSTSLKDVATTFQIIALAAIGMRINFQQVKESGIKLLAFGGIIIVVQVILATTLIAILF